ncbi:MAG: hypothetical protein H7346_19040 [Burkholderiaceae bacterium]|nr:hypothetical protein [Burkholderiaceae bacterium]
MHTNAEKRLPALIGVADACEPQWHAANAMPSDLADLEISMHAGLLSKRRRTSPSSSLPDRSCRIAESNSSNSAEVLVRNILSRAGYTLVLEAVLEYGMDFVQAQWDFMNQLNQERLPQSALNDVPRMLQNIGKGWERAAGN